MTEKIKNFIVTQLNGKYGEFFRYALVGAGTMAINYLTYALLYYACGVGLTLSNALGVIFANIFSYVGNKHKVFNTHCEDRGMLAAEMVLFFLSRAATIFIEIFGVPIMVNLMGKHPMLGKTEVVVFVIAVNYFMSKYVVFGSHDVLKKIRDKLIRKK